MFKILSDMKNWFAGIILLTTLSACETALERRLEGQKVRLLAPANNLVTTDSVHTFYWETMQGADRYQLQVVSPRFDSIARLGVDTIINRNQFGLPLRRNQVYQWRVRALNAGSSSNYSDTFQISIQ